MLLQILKGLVVQLKAKVSPTHDTYNQSRVSHIHLAVYHSQTVYSLFTRTLKIIGHHCASPNIPSAIGVHPSTQYTDAELEQYLQAWTHLILFRNEQLARGKHSPPCINHVPNLPFPQVSRRCFSSTCSQTRPL